MCGQNFCRQPEAGNQPLAFTATFSKLLIGYRTVSGYGTAEVYVDEKLAAKLLQPAGSWGQTEVVLAFQQPKESEHTVEIRVSEDSLDKPFTVTCMGIS